MKISGIYKIESIIKPDRFYIGSAIDIKDRWRCHLKDLRKNKHNSKIQNHYNKYGEKDFIFIIVELCFSQFLTVREQYYITILNPFFNICKIADSSLGVKHSKKSRENMSKAHKGQRVSPKTEFKKGLIPWNLRKNITKNLLYKEYVENRKSSLTIADENNVCKATILNYLKRFNLQARTSSETQFKKGQKSCKIKEIDKELLYKEYIINKKSSITIAKENNVCHVTVLRYLHKYNIPLRTASEAMRGNKNRNKNKEKKL